jgi:hypothetical protein
MKKMAARNYEDLLQVCASVSSLKSSINALSQCAIPVFEDLLVNRAQNKMLLDLLFTLAVWHAHAKLRIHTEKTVCDFEETTKGLGTQLRQFAKNCEKSFDTKELPQEYASRGRKAAKKNAAGGIAKGPGAAKRKLLNLNTYKLHALGHYPANI